VPDLVSHFKAKYPHANIPTRDLTGAAMTAILRFFTGFSSDPAQQFIHHFVGKVPEFDNSKIQQQLGLKFRDLWPGIDRTVELMIEHGLIKSLAK
jgi:hypothetical protein